MAHPRFCAPMATAWRAARARSPAVPIRWFERLGQPVEGTGGDGLHGAFDIASTRDQDDRQVGIAFEQAAEQRDAVAIRQLHVGRATSKIASAVAVRPVARSCTPVAHQPRSSKCAHSARLKRNIVIDDQQAQGHQHAFMVRAWTTRPIRAGKHRIGQGSALAVGAMRDTLDQHAAHNLQIGEAVIEISHLGLGQGARRSRSWIASNVSNWAISSSTKPSRCARRINCNRSRSASV